jgi:hypothetical protein
MKIQFLSRLVFFSVALSASSCSLLSPERSFLDEMNRESDGFYAPGKDFPVVGGDSGDVYRSKEEIQKRTPASERNKRLSKERLSITQELAEKEAKLNEDEAMDYQKDSKYLQSESDKLYYLSLNPSERNTLIESKVEDLSEELNSKRNMVEKRSIHNSELVIGMDKKDVIEVWGKPARVEIAGNPSHQNERWSFVEDGNIKQIYFEAGRVQGWALDL